MILKCSLILVAVFLLAVLVLVRCDLLGYGKPKVQKALKFSGIVGIFIISILLSYSIISTQSGRNIGKEMKAEEIISESSAKRESYPLESPLARNDISSDETILEESASADTETVETTTVEETVSPTSETKFIPYEYEVGLEMSRMIMDTNKFKSYYIKDRDLDSEGNLFFNSENYEYRVNFSEERNGKIIVPEMVYLDEGTYKVTSDIPGYTWINQEVAVHDDLNILKIVSEPEDPKSEFFEVSSEMLERMLMQNDSTKIEDYDYALLSYSGSFYTRERVVAEGLKLYLDTSYAHWIELHSKNTVGYFYIDVETGEITKLLKVTEEKVPYFVIMFTELDF